MAYSSFCSGASTKVRTVIRPLPPNPGLRHQNFHWEEGLVSTTLAHLHSAICDLYYLSPGPRAAALLLQPSKAFLQPGVVKVQGLHFKGRRLLGFKPISAVCLLWGLRYVFL